MIRYVAALSLLPASAFAEVPRVMTDIAPIHSLTAQVMGDLGTPDLLLPPGADPHDFALRPSDAARLGEAELVIWVGESLTPWLEEPLNTLAPNAAQFELLDTEGWEKRDIRDLKEIKASDEHDHSDHEEHEEHAAHDNHDDHAAHDKHDDHDAHDDHDHGDFDPHAWTDPAIAQVWLTAIAQELSSMDPDNSAIYSANAALAQDALAAQQDRLSARLTPLQSRGYVLPHDGYQYFETRFGLIAQGALAGIDARTPGPAQVATLRDQMTQNDIVCVFSDAEIGDRWTTILTDGIDANTAMIDAVGVGLEAGPMLYTQMLDRLADAFEACLQPSQ